MVLNLPFAPFQLLYVIPTDLMFFVTQGKPAVTLMNPYGKVIYHPCKGWTILAETAF